eukprot:284817913_2
MTRSAVGQEDKVQKLSYVCEAASDELLYNVIRKLHEGITKIRIATELKLVGHRGSFQRTRYSISILQESGEAKKANHWDRLPKCAPANKTLREILFRTRLLQQLLDMCRNVHWSATKKAVNENNKNYTDTTKLKHKWQLSTAISDTADRNIVATKSPLDLRSEIGSVQLCFKTFNHTSLSSQRICVRDSAVARIPVCGKRLALLCQKRRHCPFPALTAPPAGLFRIHFLGHPFEAAKLRDRFMRHVLKNIKTHRMNSGSIQAHGNVSPPSKTPLTRVTVRLSIRLGTRVGRQGPRSIVPGWFVRVTPSRRALVTVFSDMGHDSVQTWQSDISVNNIWRVFDLSSSGSHDQFLQPLLFW